MDDIQATKFYIRHRRENYPETEVLFYAWLGMWSLNVETAPFHAYEDVDMFDDIGPTVGVAGWIGDVWHGLQRLGKPIPPPLDYPVELREFLQRDVWQTTLGEVRAAAKPIFVKPTTHKLFAGFVWTGDAASRRTVITHRDDTPVWVSEPIDIVSEYRSFVLRDTVLDCRKYKGDWGRAPDRAVVTAAVDRFKKVAPAAYVIDWAVTADGRTALIEANDGLAFGHYGLPPVSYARMLAARWHELASN